jgi:phosphatidylglycerol:prolipoprotein diacylglycerol transferase
MWPYIRVFEFNLPVYGMMMILGVAAAIGIVILQCGYFKYPRQDAVMTALIAFAGGIAGALLLRPIIKLPDVIINWGRYSKVHIGEFLPWFIGEFVFYGGLIGGAVAVVLYCRYFKMSIPCMADIFAPALPAGHIFGRLGCLLAGCCYGIEVSPSNPFAIIYPERTDGLAAVAAPAGIPLLATPLIEAGGNIIIVCIVLLFQRRNKVTGRGISVYGILYSIMRFTLEYFRGDAIRGIYGGISTSQIISIIIFLFSVLWFFLMARKTRQTATHP